MPGMDTRLKVQIDNLNDGLRPPRSRSKGSRWDGHIFVKDAAVYGNGNRYGKQAPGQFYVGDIEDELRAIAADPAAAAAKYGHLTETCGRCGAPLEDEDSVERGIGPVCFAKYYA